MKELVEVIAKALVDNPEEVSVNEKRKAGPQYSSFMSRTAIWAK